MLTGMIDPTASPTTPTSPSSTATASSAASGSNAAASTTKKKPSNQLGQDAFLHLLVAELKNQDPTQAQDPNAMVTQMAQFSGLEQQKDSNTLLTGMQNQMSALFQNQSASMLGKKVQVTSDAMNLAGGKGSIGINLPAAASVTLTIQDKYGRTLATLNEGNMAAGNQVVKWDGRDAAGNKVADGTYTAKVAATGADGSPVNATTTGYATVTAVGYSNGAVTVTAGGQQYPLSSINEIAS